MKIIKIIILLFFGISLIYGQKPYRNATTSANFLEIGIGGAGTSMGDAYVAVANDISSIYWNPAGMAYVNGTESYFVYQPWIADINIAFVAAALNIPNVGTLGLAMTNMNYGDIEVTTVDMQEGTGEIYNANEYAVNLSYSRKLADWFAFGASTKFISSSIMHLKASAMALDLGVKVQTNFFRFRGDRSRGMSIGMSISNYGSKIKYDGIDLLNPIDIAPDENGNYKYVPGQYRMESWELPLIFRIGIALYPIKNRYNELVLAVDALHPNNASESINIGGEYQLKFPGTGAFYIRGGYKSLFQDKSEFGLTYGLGIKILMLNNTFMQFDYAYKTIGILGNTPSYTVKVVL